MSQSLDRKPNIEIGFTGLIALVFEQDAKDKTTGCIAGVVKGVSGHDLKITAKKVDPDGQETEVPVDIRAKQFAVEVNGTTTTGVTFFDEKQLKPICDEASQSYSWVLDFEGEYCYNKPIGIDISRLEPTLHINHGELYTREISKNFLFHRPALQPDTRYCVIGKVATRVGLRAYLDTRQSIASFSQDGKQLIAIGQLEGLKIEMEFAPSRPGQHGHANSYHPALGKDLSPSDKLFFDSSWLAPDPEGRATPEASCLVGSARSSRP